ALYLPPFPADPAVQLVEQLRLEYPFFLLAAPAEAVDAVLERAVPLAIELVHQARGKAPVGIGPGDALVEVDEVALVDARRRGIDDDEHLRREVLAAPVEDHARHVDVVA